MINTVNMDIVFSLDKPIVKIAKDARILFIEPFYGGSHKVLIDLLYKNVGKCSLITLPAKKWHWRARCGALCIVPYIPKITSEKVLFCSSVLNLTEILGLRPDLNSLKKIVYFHENQLVYPKQEIKQRDVQYAYNQIISCLSADVVVFNSHYNKNSFLNNIKHIIKMLPDFRPKDVIEKISCKCLVIYFPVVLPKSLELNRKDEILHIVWPHRWEFDKGPDEFFSVMTKLKSANIQFKLSVLGETFTDVPNIFEESQAKLKDEIINFGYLDSKEDYYMILGRCHVVVSTAKHEFFGVSMLEATHCGCYPLVPDALVYPEIYPSQCRYKSLEELYDRLHRFALRPLSATEEREQLPFDLTQYECDHLIPHYKRVLSFVNS